MSGRPPRLTLTFWWLPETYRAMSDDAGGAREGGQLDPSAAFSLLGNPVRLETVMALHDAGRDAPVSFADLFDRVDVEDTGRFNYHRDQLTPHFVRNVGDGYELTAAGERVARAIAAGSYTDAPELGPFGVEGACYDCGAAALRGEYTGERFRVDCRDCGQRVLDVGVPPSVVRGREPEEFVRAFERWSRDQVNRAVSGLCPDCGGALDTRVRDSEDDAVDVDCFAAFDCTVCGRNLVTSFGALALGHPDVEAFFEARGRPLSDRPYWTIEAVMRDANVEFRSEDPPRLSVTYHEGADACRVTIDGDFDVVTTEVVDGESSGDESTAAE